MFNYIVKKVAYGLLVMLGVITLIFVLFNLLPGDPARMMLGQNADRESIEILHKELGRSVLQLSQRPKPDRL